MTVKHIAKLREIRYFFIEIITCLALLLRNLYIRDSSKELKIQNSQSFNKTEASFNC